MYQFPSSPLQNATTMTGKDQKSPKNEEEGRWCQCTIGSWTIDEWHWGSSSVDDIPEASQFWPQKFRKAEKLQASGTSGDRSG